MRPIGKLGKMLLTFVFVFGFLGIVNANANDSPFIEEGTISYNVCPGAKITKVSYYFKKFKGKQTICFEVNLKKCLKRK